MTRAMTFSAGISALDIIRSIGWELRFIEPTYREVLLSRLVRRIETRMDQLDPYGIERGLPFDVYYDPSRSGDGE